MTATFNAIFYLQGSAAGTPVLVNLDASGWLTFSGFDRNFQCHLNNAQVSDRLGCAPRFLILPDMGRLETRDNDIIDAALRQFGHKGKNALWLTHLEKAPLWIFGLLILVAVSVYGGYRYGIPAVARTTAPLVPDAARQLAGRKSLEWMEQTWLEPTTLTEARQTELRQAIEQHFPDYLTSVKVSVHFYSSDYLGANAFALPDGTLVFTDQLVNLLSEPEFLAVAAHEIGHVQYDHGIRGIIGSSVLVASTLLITGDSEALSEIIITAPYALAQLSYSRSMEQEADDAARTLLEASNQDPSAFAAALRKMVDSHGGDLSDEEGWSKYLSSHPASSERIKRFE